MSESLLSSRNLAFELYEVLDAEALTQRERFADHNRETFDAALGTARSIAEKFFAPHNRKGDEQEPEYVDGAATLIPEVKPAVDAFIEAVRIDPQTIELHFALGSLFRRRGEVDRAIRIHQSLIDREDLTEEQRLQALDELGQDFLKAGLLDRAENIYRQLRDTPRQQVALKALLEIYQQEKNWTEAIETASLLRREAFIADMTSRLIVRSLRLCSSRAIAGSAVSSAIATRRSVPSSDAEIAATRPPVISLIVASMSSA